MILMGLHPGVASHQRLGAILWTTPIWTTPLSTSHNDKQLKVGYWSKFQNPQFLIDFTESWQTDTTFYADFKSVIKFHLF